jgi:hypothetical protein
MAQKYSSKLKFPNDSDFIVRVTDESFAPSKSSGNPMITLDFEVVSPETKRNGDGVECLMAGVTTKQYFVVQHLDKDGNIDAEKTKNAA